VLSAPAPGGGQNLLFALKVLERLVPNQGDAVGEDSWREAIAMASYCTFRERERRDSQRLWEEHGDSIDFLGMSKSNEQQSD
jgi:hypothetical protein